MSSISYTTFQRDFRYEKRLGKGNCSVVNQVWSIMDQCSFAQKISYCNTLDEVFQAVNEIEAINMLDDDKIVKIYYYYVSQKGQKNRQYEVGLIMELCDLNLGDLIKLKKKKNEYFTLEQLKKIIDSMIPFFSKMQKKNFVHRDIKPDNILISKNIQKGISYKIADFGFAVKLNKYSSQNIAGTMEYASPKLMVKFKDNKKTVPGHTFKDDVYSLGKTLFQFMTLQINGDMDKKKTQLIQKLYGSKYSILVMMMLKEVQSQRPDFIFLQNYCLRRYLIQVPFSSVSTEPKRTFSPARLKDQEVRTSSTSKYVQNKSQISSASTTKSLQKNRDKSKTRGRPRLDKAKNIDEVDVKVQAGNQTKSIDYKDSISSLAYFNDIIYLGSQGNLGLYHLKTQKIVKIKFDKSLKTITCIHVDSHNKNLIFGSTSCKFHITQISEIMKLLQKNTFMKYVNGIYELTLDKFPGFELDLKNPVSSFDSFVHNQTQCYVVGFFTGQIATIVNKIPMKLLSFASQPITCVKYCDGFIYSSNVSGTFKRQLPISPNLIIENRIQILQKTSSNYFLNEFKCHDVILTFQIIANCNHNKTVTKQTQKYLAILITYDGFFYIINNSLKLQKYFRISSSNLPAAYFIKDSSADIGVRAVFGNSQGVLYDEQGRQLQKTGQKSMSSIVIKGGYTIFGGYNKMLTIVKMKEKVYNIA